jgi:glutamate racemase
MNDRPIGILDSGIGGLTIAKEIITQLPQESIVYIGDSKNAPYGPQTSEQIYKHAKKLMKFLIDRDVKIVVIACNTITVNCIKKLREDYSTMPIIGTVPVVKTAAEVSRNKRIGILSTSQTAKRNMPKILPSLNMVPMILSH